MRKEGGGVHVTPISCLFGPLSQSSGGCWPLLIHVFKPADSLIWAVQEEVEREDEAVEKIAHNWLLIAIKAAEGF